MLNYNCRDCKHYNYRDDKCRFGALGADKEACWDYEPQDDYEEENEEEY